MTKRVAVIGAGPAGMSCALWLANLRLTPVLIERRARLGGLQLDSAFRNVWLLGHPAETGRSLSQRFAQHVQLENVATLTESEVVSIEPSRGGYDLAVESGGERTDLAVAALVIATGTRPRRLTALQGLTGLERLEERGFVSYYPPAWVEAVRFSRQRILVVGGGDNGYETAMFLAEFAEHVELVMRSRPRAQHWARSDVAARVADGIITVRERCRVAELRATSLGRLRVVLQQAGEDEVVEVDHVFARLGFVANTDELALLLQGLELIDDGYVDVDPHTMRTSLPFVYAVGDVCNPLNPCVATAIGSGAVAARTVERDLLAAASDLGAG